MDPHDEDLLFEIEANDDDTEIRLVVSSPTGRKIGQHEFIMALESYLHDVAQAENQRRDTNAPTH